MAVANGTIDALGVADMCRSLQGGGDKLLDADFLAEVSVSCNMSKQDLRKFRAIARERLGANACASENDEKAARTTHRKDFGLETHFFDDPTIGVDGAYIDVVAAIEKLIETRDPKGVHTPDVVHICFSNDGTDHVCVRQLVRFALTPRVVDGVTLAFSVVTMSAEKGGPSS